MLLLNILLLLTSVPVALLIKYSIESQELQTFIKNFVNVDALDGKLFVHVLPNAWPLGSPPFFVDPYGFLAKWAHTLKVGCTDCFTGRTRATKLWFKFRVQNSRVLVPFGSVARRTILTDRRFNSTMGYALMTSTIKNIIPLSTSQTSAAKNDPDFMPSTPFAWLFRKVVRPDVMEKYISMILKDIEDELHSWNKEGVLDPFDKLRRLLIIPILRITIGPEIISDPSKVKKTISGLIAIEEANGLPDFPTQPLTSLWSMIIVMLSNPLHAFSITQKKLNRLVGGISLYNLFVKAVEERRSSTTVQHNDDRDRDSQHQQDILQTLLEDREGPDIDNGAIAERLIMALFTAGGSSSSVYPWLHIFLCEHVEWKLQVEKEVQEFLAEHVHGRFSNKDSSERLAAEHVLDSLSQLDLSIWENSLPVLEKCLRETLRLVLINAVPRMNVGEPLNLAVSSERKLGLGMDHDAVGADKNNTATVEKGGFVLYLTSDVHLDETLYSDPFKFNPTRDYTDEPTDFLGWGAGLHICTGQRLARVMIKVVTVLLMSRFELGLADKVPGMDERSVPQSRLFGIGKPEKVAKLRYRSRTESNMQRQ